MESYFYAIGGVTLLLLLFIKPVRKILKKIGFILLGPAFLLAVNYIGSFFGGWIGLNLYSLLISTVMGIPGVLSLVVVRHMM